MWLAPLLSMGDLVYPSSQREMLCMWLAPLLSTGDLAVILQDQATAAKPLGSSSVTGAAYINVVSLLKREREREDESDPVLSPRLVQDCTDVRQFTVGSPQMIELNKFFDKVSSHMVLLTVANNPFLTSHPQQIIERRYFSSHRTVSEHFFLLYVSLPNLYFPSSLPSSPLSLFLLFPPSLQ